MGDTEASQTGGLSAASAEGGSKGPGWGMTAKNPCENRGGRARDFSKDHMTGRGGPGSREREEFESSIKDTALT